MIRRISVALPLVLAGVLAGCESTSSTASRPVYSTSQTGTMITQEKGLVVGVEEVLIQAPTSSSQTGAGQQVGSAVGRSIMSGNPVGAIQRTVGGMIGGAAGATLDNRVGDKITIVTDDGKTVTIVQPRDPSSAPIMPNDRVIIEVGGAASRMGSGTTRVIRDASGPDDSQVIGALPATPTTPKRVW